MASSLSNAKLLATPFAYAISQLSINRRVVGYATAAAASRGGEEASGGGGGGGEKGSTSSTHQVEEKAVIRDREHSGPTISTSWGPDPVTGYYRPDDRAAAIDTAELRDAAVNHKEIDKHQN
ncbi:hypothetical protein Vadar_010173 [Vaccinium darrowii]|uniref:Uncharacterized protein n=1 Tax=Vaccinium darrowii TaxID=229202 RepID=A0ACB7YUE9_9ERIC|nr:hypothetical protein Vadar_010173 [Vaccinium darrowii]